MKTGWERENRTHFDSFVENYDRVRPSYPAAIFANLKTYAKLTQDSKVLEIGSGTGKATAPILETGCSFTSVEAGANMAAFLESKFGGNPKYKVINVPFEEAELCDDTYDLLYAASAFHWVDASTGCPKAHRILKRGGVFALLRYNVLDLAAEDEISVAIREVYKQWFHKPYREPSKRIRDDFYTRELIAQGHGFADMREHGFVDVEMNLYDVTKTFNAEEYIELMDTMADHRSLPADDRDALYEGIVRVIESFGGSYPVQYVFQAYMGRKA